jgi:hypothetical protein
MDIDLGPLSDLTPLGVLTLTALITAVDVVVAYILAAAQGKFDLSYIATWLISHSSKRVVPIYALLAFGVGIEPAQIPPVPALFAMAVAGVAAYLGETVKSILVNFNDARAIGDESSIPKAGPVGGPQ